MKPSKKGTMGPRFHKIVKHIVEKHSPSDKDNAMSIEEEADAEGQEGKKPKLRPRDPNPKLFA